MIIPNDKHIEFYEQQIEVQENEWKKYANTSMHILVQEKKMFFGEVVGVQESQGNVILRFKAGQVPRIKQFYFLGFFGSDAPTDLLECTFSFNKFRSSLKPRYYSGVCAEIFTINYWKTENNWSYILVSGFEIDLINRIKSKFFNNNVTAKVVVAKTDPPVDYLIKLKEFVSLHSGNDILKLNLDLKEDSWVPNDLDNSFSIDKKVVSLIENNKITIIQGPPGTGKTYLAAEICNYFTGKGNSVCVTALTNRALIEIVKKEGTLQLLEDGKVFKTNLTSSESREVSNLKNHVEITPNSGELLLSTYYKLAQRQSHLTKESKRFDLIIIEEASQAYLATLAMFSNIATKVLIIGDHKQLSPIVLATEKAKEIFPKIMSVVKGLETFTFNNNPISFRLTKTRRLTSDAANLTGLFYNKSLKSISDIEGKTNFNSKFRNLFHQNGGITMAKLPDSKNGISDVDIYNLIATIVADIIKKNDKEVAVLSPYIDTESSLYEAYSAKGVGFKNITISTIQKIQGLTSDFTVVYLPLRGHDLDENLFNVSTSRAKQGTLIVTYNNISLSGSASIGTKNFINQCIDVSSLFLTELI
jgi:hypothetical protein